MFFCELDSSMSSKTGLAKAGVVLAGQALRHTGAQIGTAGAHRLNLVLHALGDVEGVEGALQ